MKENPAHAAALNMLVVDDKANIRRRSLPTSWSFFSPPPRSRTAT